MKVKGYAGRRPGEKNPDGTWRGRPPKHALWPGVYLNLREVEVYNNSIRSLTRKVK